MIPIQGIQLRIGLNTEQETFSADKRLQLPNVFGNFKSAKLIFRLRTFFSLTFIIYTRGVIH